MNVSAFLTKENLNRFESAENDLFSIVNMIADNQKLLKLIKYQSPDALSCPDLTTDEIAELIHTRIKTAPRLPVEEEETTSIIISFDSFVPNPTNTEFRDCMLIFDIMCHMDTWTLDNYQIRVYKIMGEIDKIIDKKQLHGIGRAEFVGADRLLLNNIFSGFSIRYKLINDK